MKLFASDYDGTLRMAEFVSSENKEAIHQWRAAGNMFALVSGRSMESIRKEIESNELEVDILIGNNGGVIYDPQYKELKSYYFPFAKAQDIIAYIRSERTISYVLNDGYHRSKTVLDEEREDKKYAQAKMKLSEAEILGNKQIAQIVVSLDQEEDTIRIADHINAQFGSVACAYRNVNCVDITPYGVSKSTGLSYVVKQFHIAQDQVYTIGDSFNDIPMLTTFFGFAMAQAPAQVKSYADKIVKSPAEALCWIMEHDR